jgi:hypothetical protein
VRVGKLLPGVSLAACGVALAVLASGCGGTEQDAHEPKGTYRVEVVRTHFPFKQAIARNATLVLVVRNAGASTVPNVAVTLNSLSYTSDYPRLAVKKRPVWIVNRGPGPVSTIPVKTEETFPQGGAETAYVNTWALGPLAAGASKSFVWHVTPVKAGTHTVHYTVAAGLSGKAKARLANGNLVTGVFLTHIAPKPPPTHVNPETGKIAAGAPPVPYTPQPASP